MMKIVYFSPVSINSYEQRPHFFVAEALKNGHDVLWVEPYPTRLPTLDDLRSARRLDVTQLDYLKSIKILRPLSIPMEPIGCLDALNRFLWRDLTLKIRQFEPEVLVVAKPSKLALGVINKLNIRVVFDFMDDFSDFYTGISRRSMENCIKRLFCVTDLVIASSDRLYSIAESHSTEAIKILNGYDSSPLPNPNSLGLTRSNKFVYIGAIASWFCWKSICKISELFPDYIIDLVGPLHTPVPGSLPSNIVLHGEKSREDAIKIAQEAVVGLIPFKINKLTDSVDPIKYYEYRSLAIPVVSSAFGEMRSHQANDSNLYVYDDDKDIGLCVERAIGAKQDNVDSISNFRLSCSWSNRFSKSNFKYILAVEDVER